MPRNASSAAAGPRRRRPERDGRTLARRRPRRECRIVLLCLLLACAAARSQPDPAYEAMRRGVDVRAVEAPPTRRMSPAEWRRRELAAVDRSQKIMLAARRQPGLLGQYLQMRSAWERDDALAFRLVFRQYLSWFQTFVGDYAGARATFSIAQPAQDDDAPSPVGAGWQARAADEVILRLAQDRKAVFFNEAHSAPVTRTLTVELLARLRAQGFDYFAAESLYTTDPGLQARGYPTANSGFYVAEPIHGEMVRAAIRLGFRIVAYDAQDAGDGESREKAGARALYEQTFARDPAARLVLNAGFGHIQKSGRYLGGSSMAEYFAEYSGVEPLAVEQTMLIGHAQAAQDHPLYVAAMRAPHPDQPFVFVDAGGKPWSLKPGASDVSVFFPRESLVEGRPAWLTLDHTRIPYPVGSELCRKEFPCLVEARHAGERDDAIAADRVLFDAPAKSADGARRSVLFLYPGRYRVTAVDRANRVLSAQTAEVGSPPNEEAR